MPPPTPEEWLSKAQFFHKVDRILFPKQREGRHISLASTPLLR